MVWRHKGGIRQDRVNYSKCCPAKIKRLCADKPNKGLGVHLAASGSMDTEHRFRLQQCSKAAGKPTLRELNPPRGDIDAQWAHNPPNELLNAGYNI